MCSKPMITRIYGKNFPIFGTKTSFLSFCLAASLSFCLSALPCSAAEPTYTITETELTQLEWNLSELEKINNANNKELQSLKLELKASSDILSGQRQELAVLKQDNEQLGSLLLNANKRLEQYAKEEERKRAIIKRQRTFAYILAGGLLMAYIAK